MKTCKKCGLTKDNKEFNKNKCKPDGLSTQCKACNKENLKSHYKENKKYYIEKNSKRRKDRKIFSDSLKLKCSNCDETHIACLEFHHLNPKSKEINISVAKNRGWSNKKILEEVSKCIVLCSNCHRKLHYNEKQSLVV